MIITRQLGLLTLALALIPAAAIGHHSWRAVYGGGEEVTVDATVASKPFRNPHNAMHVQIANAAGELEPWTVEWRGQRRRDGEPRPTYDLNPGDEVVIEGRIAAFPGAKKIQMFALTRPADGMSIQGRRGRRDR